ncbi:unnamed protein product [Rangifer tarandus platyrhynchus]|uniref:Uncharacterized protein n=1 Tax=Rangifer tarandus platyrhynchus TaxID=3082113 RepID=A0ABN8Y0I7_RANTA|nr:unnamed protein product [Rangifer tarandus platyrhynchus]
MQQISVEIGKCLSEDGVVSLLMNEEVNPNLEVAIKKKSPFITLGAETSKCHKREFLNEELVSEGEKYPLKILPARSQMRPWQETRGKKEREVCVFRDSCASSPPWRFPSCSLKPSGQPSPPLLVRGCRGFTLLLAQEPQFQPQSVKGKHIVLLS